MRPEGIAAKVIFLEPRMPRDRFWLRKAPWHNYEAARVKLTDAMLDQL
jgi:hypothetical protein